MDISVDLLYGLPRQTPQTLRKTVKDVLELQPARVSLFGYAHVPWMKKHQTVLEQYGLPDQTQRMVQFEAAAEALVGAGYITVGFDHFCHPDDPMAKAMNKGGLHRNFMGFTTDNAPLLLGFGASAISQFPQGYAQNASAPADYMEAIRNSDFPVIRGIGITQDDAKRRTIMEKLLCHMAVSPQLGGPSLASMIIHPARMRELVMDGIAEWRGDELRVTAKGRPFVRMVASCFDAYYMPQNRHSRL